MDMEQVSQIYHKRDFWVKENLKYVEPHFRMCKCARLINRIACGKECELLDVGCGPAALMSLLEKNIRYYGIDIAIHDPAPNLSESDFTKNPVKFGDKKFDMVVAQGVFEYIGGFQAQKFAEIKQLLKANGRFIVSYVNFDHVNRFLYKPYNNVLGFQEFRKSLAAYFHVDRIVPTSHRWHHHEPSRRVMKAIHMHINLNVGLISRLLAVEHFFICSLPGKTSRSMS